jgi:hypothetical protein
VSFSDVWSEILGTIPRLDPLLAQKLVNRAWANIRDERLWSWLIGEGVFIAPPIITAGTVTVTQFTNTVTLDATAATALTGLGTPVVTLRQFRSGLGGGSVYNITALAGSTLTLDRPYLEATKSSAPYQVYRCYYTPADMIGNPITDFLTFIVILNPIDGYAIVGENLRLTRQEIDARDPTRGAQGLPYKVSVYKADANGFPIYEFWPHPTSARGYVYAYRRRGTDLSNTVDVPGTFPLGILVEKAKDYAYDWAIANAGRFPELKGVDWMLLKAENVRKYEHNLRKAKLRDDELFLSSFIPQLRDYLAFPPADSNFLQSHDSGGWFDSSW